MNEKNLKDSLQKVLGPADENGQSTQHIVEAITKMDIDGLKVYDIAANMLMACCVLMEEEDNERLNEFLDLVKNVANRPKEATH